MWEPRRLTVLWASTACYRVSFTFTYYPTLFSLDPTINIIHISALAFLSLLSRIGSPQTVFLHISILGSSLFPCYIRDKPLPTVPAKLHNSPVLISPVYASTYPPSLLPLSMLVSCSVSPQSPYFTDSTLSQTRPMWPHIREWCNGQTGEVGNPEKQKTLQRPSPIQNL
jgi:hypothetical protein